MKDDVLTDRILNTLIKLKEEQDNVKYEVTIFREESENEKTEVRTS